MLSFKEFVARVFLLPATAMAMIGCAKDLTTWDGETPRCIGSQHNKEFSVYFAPTQRLGIARGSGTSIYDPAEYYNYVGFSFAVLIGGRDAPGPQASLMYSSNGNFELIRDETGSYKYDPINFASKIELKPPLFTGVFFNEDLYNIISKSTNGGNVLYRFHFNPAEYLIVKRFGEEVSPVLRLDQTPARTTVTSEAVETLFGRAGRESAPRADKWLSAAWRVENADLLNLEIINEETGDVIHKEEFEIKYVGEGAGFAFDNFLEPAQRAATGACTTSHFGVNFDYGAGFLTVRDDFVRSGG